MFSFSTSRITRRSLLAGAGAFAASAPFVARAQTGAPMKAQLGWLKNVESAGHFVALKKGYFAKAGLDVTLAAGGPQIDPVAILASGSADVAMVSSPLAVLAARSRGVPIVVIGCGTMKSSLGLAARADKGIKLPEGLKGAKIGYQQVNRSLLKAVLKANGVAEADVRTTVVTADPTMLIEGRIDLMTVSVLNVPLAMKGRGIEPQSWLAYDLGVPLQGQVVTCLESKLAARGDDIGRFLNALGQGWAYTVANPDEVAETVAAEFGEGLNADHQKAYNRGQVPLISTPVTKVNGLFYIDRPTWETANTVALETGLIDSKVDLAKLLKPSVLDAAALPKV
jgi:NitT/TauT family transport system substrate-binding protein